MAGDGGGELAYVDHGPLNEGPWGKDVMRLRKEDNLKVLKEYGVNAGSEEYTPNNV